MKHVLTFVFLASAAMLSSGCELIGTAGPSNALIERELSEETLTATKGIFDVKARVLSRKVHSDDLVDIEVELTMIRTSAEIPTELKARAILDKGYGGDGSMLAALQLPPGSELAAEIKTFTYKRLGEGWQRDS